MTARSMNPLQLAVTLHWSPEDDATRRSTDARRVLDHWLRQIEHYDAVFAPEYVEAPALLAELFIEEDGHQGRVARVEADERFHHWGLCQHVIAESQRAACNSAVLSRDLSELAVTVALRLDPRHYHPSWTEDIRAKAWCVYADACRRLSQTDDAVGALNKARRHARSGTKNAELAARIEKTEMSLSWRNGEASNAGAAAFAGSVPPSGLSDQPSSHSRIV